MAIRKHESSQSCEVCVCVGVGCNGSLCCCCEGIRRTESNTSEKECAAECQCKEQSERATERESALGNTLSLECALSIECALSAVHSLCCVLSLAVALSRHFCLWSVLASTHCGTKLTTTTRHWANCRRWELRAEAALAQLLLLLRLLARK